jgi:uncharacterized protein YjbI with pentapeptide repeats
MENSWRKIRARCLRIVLGLVWLWLLGLLSAAPALAIGQTVNYSHGNLNNHDFSHQDLTGGVFVEAEMRGANESRCQSDAGNFDKRGAASR